MDKYSADKQIAFIFKHEHMVWKVFRVDPVFKNSI